MQGAQAPVQHGREVMQLQEFWGAVRGVAAVARWRGGGWRWRYEPGLSTLGPPAVSRTRLRGWSARCLAARRRVGAPSHPPSANVTGGSPATYSQGLVARQARQAPLSGYPGETPGTGDPPTSLSPQEHRATARARASQDRRLSRSRRRAAPPAGDRRWRSARGSGRRTCWPGGSSRPGRHPRHGPPR